MTWLLIHRANRQRFQGSLGTDFSILITEGFDKASQEVLFDISFIA